jgi:hypothetical protein
MPEAFDKAFGPCQLAAEPVADPDRNVGRRLLAFRDDIEVGIERGGLEDLRLGQLHQFGEGRQVSGREMPEGILDGVQILDQQIAADGLGPEKPAHLVHGHRVYLTAFRYRPCGVLSLARMPEADDFGF